MPYYTNVLTIQTNNEEIVLTELKPSRLLDKNETFFLIQTLRKKYKTDLFLLKGKKIFVVSNSKSNFLEWKQKVLLTEEIKDIEFSRSEKLVIPLFSNKILDVRHLLGEILATHLRRQGYFIEPKKDGAFRASSFNDLIREQEVEAWPGFEYQFIIEEKSIKLIIDPKFRLNIAMDLSTEKKTKKQANKKFHIKEGEFLKDICLISDCDERFDPYHRCKLAGVGSTAIFSNWLEEKPTELGQTQINVKDYLKIINCPSQQLPSKIDENQQTLQVIFRKFKDPRKYPLERLSRIPNLGEIIKFIYPSMEKSELNKDQYEVIREFIQKIQPGSIKRLESTKRYYNSIRNFSVNGLSPLFVNNIAEYNDFDSKFFILERPELLFGEKKDSSSKSKSNFDPLHLPTLNNLFYVSFLDDEITVKLIQEIESRFSLCLGITNVHLSRITEQEINKRAAGSVGLFLLKDSTQHKKYENLKVKLLKNSIYIQKITEDNLKPHLEIVNSKNKKKIASLKRKRANHIDNVILGIFCKVGGIPWKIGLGKDTEQNNLMMGWKVLSFHKEREKSQRYFIILSFYNESGIHLNSSFLITKEESYIKASKDFIISSIVKNIENFSIVNLDIHRDGRFFDEKDTEIIDNIKSVCQNNSINLNLISISDGIIRIFSINEDDKGKVNSKRITDGTVFELNSNHYAMSTFSLPIDEEFRTEQTIQIKLEYLSKKNENQLILQRLFNLTRGYHGYLFKRIKHPVTIHACRKISSIYDRHKEDFTIPYKKTFDREFFV